MSGQGSIVGRLMRSLAFVAVLGSVLLVLFIGVEYQLSISDFSGPGVIHELNEHVIIPLILLALPMALAGRWAILRAVKPLETAAHKIQGVQGEGRGVRIDLGSLPEETVPFAEAVNALLDRVDHASAMHEAFAADIAHELRTPLTLLSLELDQMEGAKAEQLRLDVGAMRRLIDQLMLLAQVDAERAAQLPPTQIDLTELAGDVVAQLAPAALSAGKLIELHGEMSGTVAGRREAVAAALRNLVENALRVTPANVPVIILANRSGELAVRDGGAGLSTEQLATLVQRHRRADHASSSGAGLGLAIVARIMAAHGGALVTDPAKRELRLIFPAL